MKVDYLQIGSHIGNTDNDPVFNNITQGMNVILIEPMPNLFSKLVVNYNHKVSKNNIEFLNIAVSTHDGILDLYSYSPPPQTKVVWNKIFEHPNLKWADQLASVNKYHIRNHNFNVYTTKTTVPCKTLNSIIRERNISSIVNLHTDTEGHDYDILMSLDLTLIKPINIIFENAHTDGTKIRGKKYDALIEHFKNNDYHVVWSNDQDTQLSLS
jgi:hypothetical protein